MSHKATDQFSGKKDGVYRMLTVNILGFDDFLKEESWKDGKQHKVSEDYIHSFIAEHEPDHDPYEEE